MLDQLPHRGLEDWKWSDLKQAAGATKPAGFDASMAVSIHGPEAADQKGLSLAGPDVTENVDVMSRIAAAYANGVTSIVVPEGETYEKPLEIRDLDSGNAQIKIDVGKGATLHVEEHHSSDAGFVNLDIRYIVREGGTLTRSVVTQDGADVIRHVRASVTLWADATFRQTQLTFGSALTRLETRVACMGKVDVEMSGAYLLSDKRHADITNYIDFATPGSVVRDAVAGVVTDRSRGVFQGKFHVRRPAQQTDAVMRHDALMLSDTAKINAKPELEIYADDVLCEHGNTIGQLDEQAMFYMRQRGIPKAQARALLIEAFVVARLGEDEAMVTLVRDWLDGQA